VFFLGFWWCFFFVGVGEVLGKFWGGGGGGGLV